MSESDGSGVVLCRGSSFRVAFRMIFSYNRRDKLMFCNEIQKKMRYSKNFFHRIHSGIAGTFCNIFSKKFNFLLA